MNYTPNEPPRTLTAAEIEKILPHRYPFALVDKILDYTPGQWAWPGGHRQSHRLGGWCARGQRRADICYHGCLRAGFAWWIVL